MARFPQALNEQVGHEFGASQQYVAIAVYYDSENLPQLAAHFYRQAVEERNHAMMMVQYLLDADKDVVTPGIDPPQTDFADPVAPVALALAQEKRVTDQIVELERIHLRAQHARFDAAQIEQVRNEPVEVLDLTVDRIDARVLDLLVGVRARP